MHTIILMLSNSKFTKGGRRELQVLRDKSSGSQIKMKRLKQIERLVDPGNITLNSNQYNYYTVQFS